MIALRHDCLLFQLHNGESVPCSAQMISVEITGDLGGALDPDLLRHVATSVFHYFKIELQREAVTLAEFSGALEKVLQHLGYAMLSREGMEAEISRADLGRLAREAGGSLELFFFPRLRSELHSRLQESPRVLHFRGLRGCVKQLAGARRWSPRCERIQDRIVEFLRRCLDREARKADCALMVE